MLDKDDEKLYAYALTGGSRDSGLDIDLDDNGENYNSIWSDGTTMYVVENTGGSASRDPQIHKLPLPASVLVSNAGQTAGANTGADTERAQTFRTGDNYHGYTLESVKLFTGNSVSVDLAVWTTDANGHPDALHATLTPPASFAAGEIEFTDPADSRLERNTTYALRISSPTSARLQLPITASSAEDASSKSGWSIGDDFLLLSSTTNAWGPSGTGWAYRVTIKGTPNPDTVPAAITGLRASGLDGGVALSWGLPDHGGAAITKFQYRQKESGAYGSWMDISGSGPATTSYAVTSLTNDTEYTFQVRAVNAVGDAQPSNEATATPKADECGQGTSDSPCMLTVGTASAGAIQRQSDDDWYQLDMLADTTYQIDLKGAPSNSGTLADPFIGGLYTKGALVEFGLGRIPDTYNDDISSTNKDARVIWTAHRDITVFISVYSGDVIYIDSPKTLGIGTYTLTVTQLSGPPPTLSEPPPAAAPRTLLSNFNVGDRRVATIIDPDPEHYDHITEFSQPFTTGSNSQGYTLGSIGLIGRDWLHGPPPLIVTLRSDFGGNPSSTVLATFTNFPSWKPVGPDGGLIFSIFRAPSGTTLNPNTKYHIHIQPTGRVKLETVEDSGETGGSLSGWDIGNSRRRTLNDPNWHSVYHPDHAVRLGVFGQVTGQQTAQATSTVRAPMIFIATAKGPAQVDLIWTTPEFGAAAGYGIQRSADGETGWQAVGPLDDDGDTMYRHVGLTPETTYHYRMRYLTEDGPGEWTYPVAATTATDAWQLTAAAVSKTQVDLSWTAAEEEFTGYYVEWSAEGRTGWTATDPIHSGIEASYSHNGLTGGTTYHYRVLAVNGNIPGAWSPVVSATTEEADNTPATGALTITGTAQAGETLTADTSGIADADGLTNAAFAYQWQADGAEISGANGSAYTLAGGDKSKVISVPGAFVGSRIVQ